MTPRPDLARPKRARSAIAAGAVCLAVAATALSQPAPVAAEGPPIEGFRPQLITVDTYDRADKALLQSLGLDLTEHAGHDYVEVVVHSPADLRSIEAAGLTYDVRIPDLIKREAENNLVNAAYAASVDQSPLPSGRDTYRTLADYNADMVDLAKANPKLVKHFALPRPSLDGRTVYGIEIGRNIHKRDRGRPTFLLMGLHHAREWPSGEMAIEFAFDLVNNFGKDKRITKLLRQARVIVIPVVNVDGFHLSRTDGELVDLNAANEHDPTGGTGVILGTPGRAYMRKNCRVVDGEDTPDGSCGALLATPGGYGHGVDLNRNYGGFWGGPGASTVQADPTYRGATAFSEPEIQNIADIVRNRQVTMMISNHTFSNLILRPNGVNPQTIGSDGLPVGDAPDEEALKALGAQMAAQNGYANIHGWQLYDTTGTTEDYTYNATGGFGYTFEIGAHEFHPPFPQVVDEYVGAGEYAGKGLRESYLIALAHASDKKYSGVLRGKGPKRATLRLTKTFQSPTWEGSFADGVTSAIKLGRTGRFSWMVNPSTRPVVRSRTYQVLGDAPFRTETIEGTTATPNNHTDTEFVVTGQTGLMRIELDWPTPDDLDLEVYKRVGEGLVEVGSSGNLPGEKEVADVPNAEPGTYVLRVINYASVSPTYTLKASLFDAVTKTTPGKREKYLLTCEVKGKVLQRKLIYVDRGQVRNLNLQKCIRRAR
ncbi:M14 family metallopeptidase [Nocardioides dilutus]